MLSRPNSALPRYLTVLQALPLRVTKSFLTYSVERIEKGSPAYQASCTLWQDGFQLILPELLKFLRFFALKFCESSSVLTVIQLRPRVP